MPVVRGCLFSKSFFFNCPEGLVLKATASSTRHLLSPLDVPCGIPPTLHGPVSCHSPDLGISTVRTFLHHLLVREKHLKGQLTILAVGCWPPLSALHHPQLFTNLAMQSVGRQEWAVFKRHRPVCCLNSVLYKFWNSYDTIEQQRVYAKVRRIFWLLNSYSNDRISFIRGYLGMRPMVNCVVLNLRSTTTGYKNSPYLLSYAREIRVIADRPPPPLSSKWNI